MTKDLRPIANLSQPDQIEAERKLPPEAQELISRRLRECYDAALNEDVPDKFTKLLAKLAEMK